jgi:hypothetical protein
MATKPSYGSKIARVTVPARRPPQHGQPIIQKGA